MLKLSLFIFRICPVFIFFTFGCDISKRSGTIIVQGDIKGLPDGTMYLTDRRLNKIDSTKTSGGKFNFEIPSSDFPEPVYAQLHHIGNVDRVKRLFTFPTKRKQSSIGLIMLEPEGAKINGVLKETNFGNLKMASVDGEVTFGTQTKVLYSESPDFSKSRTINAIKDQIKANPYSYHYLYEVNEWMRGSKDDQLLAILKCFDEDIQSSKTAMDLKKYIANRGNKKLDFALTMPDTNNVATQILDPSAKLHMLVLWASWCGPCRAGIPQLNRIYEKFSSTKQFKMVSISLDDDTNKWKDALRKEKMPWKQVLMTPDIETYARDIFGYNRSVPLTLFVDDKGRIVKKYIGYDKSSEVQFLKLISDNVSL